MLKRLFSYLFGIHFHDYNKWMITSEFDVKGKLNNCVGKLIEQRKSCNICGFTKINLIRTYIDGGVS